MCNKVKSLLRQISCYLPYILNVEVESDEYRVLKEEEHNKEILFEGSRKGCIEYLNHMKCEVYNYNRQVLIDFKRGW